MLTTMKRSFTCHPFRRIYRNPTLWIVFCLLWFPVSPLHGQSLVDNPSFEQNTNLPTGGGQMFLVPPWNEAFPTMTTPDYFHTGSTAIGVTLPTTFIGQVNPYHGQAVAGLYTFITNGYREYIRTKLNTPMQVGQMYRLRFALTKGNQVSPFAANASDGFGALFSTYPPNQQQYGPFYSSNIPVMPQWEMTQMFSSTTWINFEIDIWADSAYEYLTFGNFKDNTHTTLDPVTMFLVEYLYIDSVALTPVLELTGPEEACIGDTVTYGAYPAGGLYSWTVNGIAAGAGDSLSFVMTDTSLVELIAPGASRTQTVVFRPDPKPDLGPDLLLCDGDTATLMIPPFHDWIMTWPDGSQGIQFQTIDSGWVKVLVDSMGCPGIDSVFIDTKNFPSIDLGTDTTLCDGEILSLTLPPGDQYSWSTGGTVVTETIGTAGLVWGEMTNGCGTDRDTVEISFLSPPMISLPSDTALCESDSLLLEIIPEPTWSIEWQDQQAVWSRWGLPDGTYTATVSNRCGLDVASISLGEILIPQLELGPDRQFCENEDLLLIPSANVFPILWEDGSSAPQRVISSSGLYAASLMNVCGLARDSLEVTQIPFPQVDLGPDTSVCQGEFVQLSVLQQGVEILWGNGSTEPVRIVGESGRYEVQVSNICGRVQSARTITVEDPLAFTLPPDTQICSGDQLVLNRPQGITDFSWPDGTSEEIFVVETAGRYVAQAINACGTVFDDILVETYDCGCQLFVPTAFSPNGDGENDTFFLGTECEAASFTFTIYDRWGRQVVSFNGTDFRWDGQNYSEGVYLWKAESAWVGRTNTLLTRTQSGTITLIR